MFNTRSFKTVALQNLRGKWKLSLLVAAIGLAIQGISSLPFTRIHLDETSYHHSFNLDLTSLLFLLPLAITGINEMAQAFFFTRLATDRENASFLTFIDGLNLWLKGILATLWSFLWSFLWSLLFVIPGIVKLYAYSQIYFILAEHPNMSVRKALELSKIITRGYKGNLFFMDLSFLGWAILCSFTGGLGFIVLIPYLTGTKVQAYRFLKNQALSIGLLHEADFSDNF